MTSGRGHCGEGNAGHRGGRVIQCTAAFFIYTNRARDEKQGDGGLYGTIPDATMMPSYGVRVVQQRFVPLCVLIFPTFFCITL